MRVLVTFAVEAEFAPWRKLRHLQRICVGEMSLHRGQIGRAQVDFVVTGMGPENAHRVSDLAMQQQYQFCVTAGFAGSLSAKHTVGDVLVAEAVQYLGKSKTLQCSRNLVHAARDDGAKQVKLLLTSGHVVRTAEEKAQLASFADAVDMESYEILAVAREKKLPAVAIRVISDNFDKELPADIDLTVGKRGQLKVAGLLRFLGRHPIRLPALIRLGRDSHTAAEALAAFLEAHIKKISFFTHGWFPEGQGLEEVAAR